MRRVVENAFRISRARWRIFSHAINASVETAELITKATMWGTSLMAFVTVAIKRPGEWCKLVSREGNGAMGAIAPLRGRRNALMNYAMSDVGSVPGQWENVRSREPLQSSTLTRAK